MQKLTALILASRDVGEFDRLYFLYAREAGFVKVMGRGVRKQTAKLAGHLEPGTLSEVYVARSRGMGQITSVITLESFDIVKKDFAKIEKVLAIFRFFAKNFAEDEKDERIFDLLKEFLNILSEADSAEGVEMLTEAFWWKLFDFLGHRPETMKCAKCGTGLEEERRKFFSAARGGTICEKCLTGENNLSEISANQIKLLRIFLANSLEKILKVKAGDKELGELGKIREEFRKYNF